MYLHKARQTRWFRNIIDTSCVLRLKACIKRKPILFYSYFAVILMAKVVWKKLFYESVRFFTEMIKIHLLVSNKTFFIQTCPTVLNRTFSVLFIWMSTLTRFFFMERQEFSCLIFVSLRLGLNPMLFRFLKTTICRLSSEVFERFDGSNVTRRTETHSYSAHCCSCWDFVKNPVVRMSEASPENIVAISVLFSKPLDLY